MFPLIQLPEIDLISFLIGFLTATIFWWLVKQVRPLLTQISANWKAQREVNLARRSSDVEEHHRQNVLRVAQGMHLAAPLFSLDEIFIQPRLLAPPARLAPGDPPPHDDAVTHSLPYLPGWPELAAIYLPPALSLSEALSGNTNLVITGQPGMGKTFTLAYLASLVCHHDPALGVLQNATPFLLHVADMNLAAIDVRDVLKPIVDAIAENTPVLDLPRLPNFVQYSFRSAQALLILDGVDELPQDDIRKVCGFFDAVLKAYPKTRVVTCGNLEYLDGLLALGFAPLSLMPWTNEVQQKFIEHWGEVWSKFISMEAWAQIGPESVDPILLNAWLSSDNFGLTPLELTLKAWGAYAGDGLGPHRLDAIESHLRRVTPSGIAAGAVDVLAMQVILSAQPIFNAQTAREWIRSFEPPEEKPVEEDATQEISGKEKKQTKTKITPKPGLLPKMAESGLLQSHLNNRMRFCHPVIGAYVAGRALAAYETSAKLFEHAPWSGQLLAMRYLAAFGDAAPLVELMLSKSRQPLEQSLLITARWLSDAPRQAVWRGKIMAALARLMQTEGLPLGLRGQACAALTMSRDPGAAALFRQFLQLQSSDSVCLAALGSGALADVKAVAPLTNLLKLQDFYVRRAACLALVAIGSAPALEAVASSLLHGDEDLRRAAAEALANNPKEGHPTLQEGAFIPDILVRRAAVYGLGRIKEDWAKEILAKIQIEDAQWVVRSAATEVIDYNTRPSPYIPQRLTLPSETPWLIAFAGTQGMGISPGEPATSILLMALNSDNTDERLAALPYICQTPDKEVIAGLYAALYSGEREMREATFQYLAQIASSGVNLPDPRELGLD